MPMHMTHTNTCMYSISPNLNCPNYVNSYAVNFLPSLLLFRGMGEEAELIQQTFNSLTDEIRMFHLNQLELPPDLSLKLADWNNLLEFSANWVVKAQMSPQYLCWVYLRNDDPQLWFFTVGRKIGFMGLMLFQNIFGASIIRGVKRPPKAGHVTDVIRERGEFYLISAGQVDGKGPI